jgi:lipopolysaccharide/colanic/teichoic acid biosynthesis glycosyltransferase
MREVRVAPNDAMSGSALIFECQPLPAGALLVKRGMDVVLSSLALVLLAPLMAVLALIIKLESSGPVLYRSWRVGQNGKLFVFLKFRTMVANAEELKESLQHLNEREGLLFKISNDPRATRLGRFLRRYSLDELPQLVNVLRGEMALVGPRPPSLDEYELYTAEHQIRLAAKPGITGLWQITARTDPSFTTALNLDRSYIERWSPWLDLKILLKTMPVVLQGEGQ